MFTCCGPCAILAWRAKIGGFRIAASASHVVRHWDLGGRYAGRGLLTWDPEAGFHLESFVDRDETPLPSPITLGAVKVIRKSEVTSIRMRLQHGGYAIAPEVPLVDRFDLLHQRRLSARLGRVQFMYQRRLRPSRAARSTPV